MVAKEQPIVILTMGDPAGIGPEIVVKYLAGSRRKNVTLVVAGEKQLLQDTAAKLKLDIGDINVVSRPSREKFERDAANIVSLKVGGLKDLEPGRPDARTGRAAMAFVDKATDLVMLHEADAVVTAPLSKRAINEAGYFFTGHTDYFAARTNTSKYAMCFVADAWRVALVTAHLPVRKIHSKIKLARIIRTVSLFHDFIRTVGEKNPRIVVTGLNPHAGEDGLLGTEELNEIAPAVGACQSRGMDVDGPVSAEAAFLAHTADRYDGIVAMYHDQGLVPLKALMPYKTVNVTLGLPFVRTSVGHGAAFDIAGRGTAKVESLRNAVNLAAKLVRARRKR